MSDGPVRNAAFDWLAHQVDALGTDVLPWKLLMAGFHFQGARVPLLSMQGIFKPAVMDLPLSIRTSAGGPYKDAFGTDGLLRYAYRGENPEHPDNRGLRGLMQRRQPLVYFHGIAKGEYLATWPVFVVADEPKALNFRVAVDDARVLQWSEAGLVTNYDLASEQGDERRRYITREMKVRLHQRSFRHRVLHAYKRRCALFRLRHQELLDAAHIVPDSDPRGEPEVPNGLALCKLHHAAFDRHFIGIRPDYVVEVRQAILDEEDGPMLLHGLKGLHEQRIAIPTAAHLRPDRERLAERFEQYRSGQA